MTGDSLFEEAVEGLSEVLDLELAAEVEIGLGMLDLDGFLFVTGVSFDFVDSSLPCDLEVEVESGLLSVFVVIGRDDAATEL